MAKAVRLSDIGEQLGVSAVTVSKALSGQKGVSDDLRQRIIELADELGYTKTKSGVEEKKSYTLGLVVAERYLKEGQSFYWNLYQEVLQKAIARNCFLILEVITYEAEREPELPKVLSEQKIDGIIIMGTFKAEYVSFLAENIKIPSLSLDTLGIMDTHDSVVSNNLMGGYRMTNYLFEMGHSRIGFVGTRLATDSIDDRYLGYLKSLMAHGVRQKEEWIIEDRDREMGRIDPGKKFCLPEEMPTAFFCNCDVAADILIHKLNAAGYMVPEDISVAGFDNYLISQSGKPGITTYEIHIDEMAERAVHILVHKLKNMNYSTGVFLLPGTFIERDSVRRIGSAVPFISAK
ncbi:MAG: LacI family DNA-binding transcriptional regulator [Lachnospiraceae bacterium]|mgnify:CR=1 FL=1